jgi:hypothetical protein
MIQDPDFGTPILCMCADCCAIDPERLLQCQFCGEEPCVCEEDENPG